jgi:hypothetical protein
MASGTSINAGAGTVSLELRDGAGKTHTASGDITTRDITAGRISVINRGPDAGSGVVLQGTLTATAAAGGNPATLVVAGQDFTNATGAGALVASGAGSLWQVWSGSPGSDSVGGLAYDYKQYGATYGSSTPLGTGKGLLYSLSPQLTVSLAGTVQKTYDGNTAIGLSADNYTLSGAIDGDTVSLNNPPLSGTLDNKNAGNSKLVSVSGLTASASNGTAPVYGYTLASTSISANIGTVNPKVLTMTGTSAADKTYDGNTNAAITVGTLSGFVGAETVSATAAGSFNS